MRIWAYAAMLGLLVFSADVPTRLTAGKNGARQQTLSGDPGPHWPCCCAVATFLFLATRWRHRLMVRSRK